MMTSNVCFNTGIHDQMLESNRDDVKLEAMRCVTVMTAKGKLTIPRTLFPHIVKNVSSSNPELKKLIYLYLTSYADQEPDLALLPVATLQKSLKTPNPLMRSCAIKVLTSMRLSILSPIFIATLRNSVNDLSPYVRRTVAHSIIKIYRLEPSLREDLVEYVERLMNDKNSIVLSSSIAAFEYVCPERLDLIHRHYRRFCFALADCNEWGQAVMINSLLRYILKTHKKLRSGKAIRVGDQVLEYVPTEHDPKILLRAAKPLIHSDKASVVMAVIKLYMAIADHNEVRSTIAKPMIRLLTSHKEIQYQVLSLIQQLTMLDDATHQRSLSKITASDDKRKDSNFYREMFRSYIKSFFVKHNDCTLIRLAKIRILINLSSSVNVTLVLRELQAYIAGYVEDREFVSASIQAIGRCAIIVKEVAHTCLHGLTSLLSNNNEHIVSEAIVVLRSQIITKKPRLNDNNTETIANESTEHQSDYDYCTIDDNQIEEVSPVKLVGTIDNNNHNNNVQSDDEDNSEASDENDDEDSGSSESDDEDEDEDEEGDDDDDESSERGSVVDDADELTDGKGNNCIEDKIAEAETEVDDQESIVLEQVEKTSVIATEPTVPVCNDNEEQGFTVVNNDTTEAHKESDRDNDEDSVDEKVTDDKIVSTVIKQVTKLLPKVKAPQARATILWILAEFCDKNITAAKCAPDIIRQVSKSFCQEENYVKLQSLTLATKFYLSLSKERKADLAHKVHLLAQYLFSLAKYDINHDVRDRGRFLKKLLEDDENVCSRVLNVTNKFDEPETKLAIEAVS